MDTTRWITAFRDKMPVIDRTAFVDVSARIVGATCRSFDHTLSAAFTEIC